MSRYDVIGVTYTRTRQPDPRIQDAIWGAMGEAKSVVNVGAGTGSYEPPQTVLAVDPSRVMVSQRRPGLAPAVLGTASTIPLPDRSVDVALALFTVHHWSDLEEGLAEIRRVARRVVILTWDQKVMESFWLGDYLPAIIEASQQVSVPIQRLSDLLGGASITPVPVPHDCRDGFLGAYWRRPKAYLDPVARAGISAFASLDPGALARGLTALESDLTSGRWQRRHSELLDLPDLDLGYRLVVADCDG
jgi:SAM-dependent methyltransferase